MTNESIQSQGGKARAEKLSKEELKKIAQKAALARWANRPPKALHKGNFKEHFGVDIDAYVLDDERKSAVLSERGLSRALGFSPTGGNRLKDFLSTKTMEEPGREVARKLLQPIEFQSPSGGREESVTVLKGYPATVLIELCKLISSSAQTGVLGKRHERMITQSRIILDASANLGIDHLVYAIAGYNPTANEVIKAFKLYVEEEAKKYEKEFPPELYKAWYRLYEIPPIQGRGRPWEFKQLTVKHIYTPLAESNGKILELTRAVKASAGDRKKKLFQFLSDVGTRALRMHLGRVLEMAESSPDRHAYEAKIVQRFGGQQQLELVIPEPKKEVVEA